LKREAIRGKNLHVVAPSRWLTEAAQRSAVFASARSFRTIPYGLDISSFAPQARSVARNEFQLPENAFVLGFGADSLTNRRKGWPELLAALKQVRASQPPVAFVFGGGALPAENELGMRIVSAGYVRDPLRLANLYSAMNVFVLPSLEDNLPQTGLEAMACGTPVIAFDAGGIPDFVVPEQTGLLARSRDVADLARQIQRVVDHPADLIHMGQHARQLVVERFNGQLEANRYVALYRELVAELRHGQQPAAA
jgi:glycosyltransferase involved in cell wall biosynthesis